MKQYKNILVSVDIFEDYRSIVKQALFLAKKFNAKVNFIYVQPNIDAAVPYAYGVEGAIEVDSQKQLDELEKLTQVDKNQIHLCHGNPKNKISSFAEELKTDLIVVGSHGRKGLDLLLGSTANSILHTAKCDVLTVRVNQDNKCLVSGDYKNILLATDLEKDNKTVIDRAKVISSSYNAKLHIINVIANATATAIAYYPNLEMELRDEAEKKIKKLAKNIGVDESNAHTLIGAPKTTIVDLAQETHSELIVIGSHSRNIFTTVLLGSTANAVLHMAKQDILVVRIKK